MIRIAIKQSAGIILDLHVSGHAQSGKSGHDLVCAGVSSVATGILNACSILAEDSCFLELQDSPKAMIHIQVKNQNDSTLQIILKTAVIQMETIKNRYTQYINITKQEV